MDLALPKRPQPKNNFAAILVSLYLVLLAFFIMLNAISSFEPARHKRVVDSVMEAFSKTKIDNIDAPEWLAEPGLEVMIQNYFAEMREALAILAPLEELQIMETKDSLTVRFATDTLFTPKEVAIRHGKHSSLNEWAGIIQRWKDSFRLEVEAVIGSPPLGLAPTAKELSIARSGLLAQELLKRGIMADQLNIGLDSSMDGQMELTFVARASGVTFSPLGAVTPDSPSNIENTPPVSGSTR